MHASWPIGWRVRGAAGHADVRSCKTRAARSKGFGPKKKRGTKFFPAEPAGEDSRVEQAAARGEQRKQPPKRRRRLPLTSPLLTYWADLLDVEPEEIELTPILEATAWYYEDEQSGAPHVTNDPLYQARLGTAVLLERILRLPTRTQRLKQLVKLAGAIREDIRGSLDWRHAQQALASLEQETPGWAWDRVKVMHVLCIGSVEARGDYAENAGINVPKGAAESFLRPWAAARALWQLVLAFMLAEQLPGRAHAVRFEDPALSAQDRRLIAELGGEVVEANATGGAVALQKPTLVFAPGCPHICNERLMESAMQQSRLLDVAYLGTCASYYKEIRDMWQRYVGSSSLPGPLELPDPGEPGPPRPADQAAPGPAPGGCGCGAGGGQRDWEADDFFQDPEDSRWAALAAQGGVVEVPFPALGGALTGPSMRLHAFPSSAPEGP